MESVKHFTFSDDQNSLNVSIPEVVEGAYGMYVWPCAPVLAQYVWHHRSHVTGKRILEIGAGTSLPGVVAAKCGGHLTLSDCARFPRCLDNCRKSCQANGLEDIRVVGITWGEFTPDLLNLPPQDIILGSDCFYATKDFEDVLSTVAYLLEQNSRGQFWTTYQERSADRSIEHLLMRWKLTCQHVPLTIFGADSPELACSDLPGDHTVHMMVISQVT